MLFHDRLQEIIHEFDLLLGKADLGAFGGKSQKKIKLVSAHEHLLDKPSPLSPHALTVIDRRRGAGGFCNMIYSDSFNNCQPEAGGPEGGDLGEVKGRPCSTNSF